MINIFFACAVGNSCMRVWRSQGVRYGESFTHSRHYLSRRKRSLHRSTIRKRCKIQRLKIWGILIGTYSPHNLHPEGVMPISLKDLCERVHWVVTLWSCVRQIILQTLPPGGRGMLHKTQVKMRVRIMAMSTLLQSQGLISHRQRVDDVSRHQFWSKQARTNDGKCEVSERFCVLKQEFVL